MAGFYWLGVLGARSVGGGFSARRLAQEFAHSLVPIALAYVAAHYFTLLLFQGQAIVLASDPLGKGSDIFGTADSQIDYTLIGADATWYWQVGFVVAGHVAADARARPRAGPLRRPQAGRALAVLDARGDGRLHEPRPLATVVGELMTFLIAHASTWLTTIAYFVPVVAFLVWLGSRRSERWRGRHEQ